MDSSKSAIQAWEYNPKNEDQMLPHKYEPNRPVPLSHVHDLGILTWKIDVSDWENDPQLKKITSERGYKYSEVITVSRDAMVDFDAKVKGFFREHMHSQEESRLILGGTGECTAAHLLRDRSGIVLSMGQTTLKRKTKQQQQQQPFIPP